MVIIGLHGKRNRDEERKRRETGMKSIGEEKQG